MMMIDFYGSSESHALFRAFRGITLLRLLICCRTLWLLQVTLLVGTWAQDNTKLVSRFRLRYTKLQEWTAYTPNRRGRKPIELSNSNYIWWRNYKFWSSGLFISNIGQRAIPL